MAFCTECGKQIPDGTRFCPYCGAEAEAAPQAAPEQPQGETPVKTGFVGQLSEYFNINGPLPYGEEKADAEQNKLWGILAYVFFAIPLFGAKDSKFARFHANNSLWITIVYAALGTLEGIFSGIATANFTFGFFGFLGVLTGIAMLVPTVLWVFGLIHAIKGMKKDLPLVGNIKIIK